MSRWDLRTPLLTQVTKIVAWLGENSRPCEPASAYQLETALMRELRKWPARPRDGEPKTGRMRLGRGEPARHVETDELTEFENTDEYTAI